MKGVQRTTMRQATRHSDVPLQDSRQDSAADAHALSGHVLHHHAGADLRRICRADEVQHDGRVHDSVGHAGLLPALPLGVGRRHAGLYGGATAMALPGGALDFAGGTVVHISSGVSALICALLMGKRLGYRHRADAAAQPDLHGARRGDAVGRLVWLQRRQRAGFRRLGLQRFCRNAFFRGRRGSCLGRHGMDHARQAERARGLLGRWSRAWSASRRPRAMCCRCRRSAWAWRSASFASWPAPSSKSKFGYDDSLDAFGVHGVGGTLGAMLTGVFATRAVSGPDSDGKPIGLDRRRRNC